LVPARERNPRPTSAIALTILTGSIAEAGDAQDLNHSFLATKAIRMNKVVRSQDFFQPLRKPRLFQRLLNALKTILASPEGDQGGWEGGCRGL